MTASYRPVVPPRRKFRSLEWSIAALYAEAADIEKALGLTFQKRSEDGLGTFLSMFGEFCYGRWSTMFEISASPAKFFELQVESEDANEEFARTFLEMTGLDQFPHVLTENWP
ncbi:hypothetical protein [Labrys sp. ZIDIC5]|uniref:hypothetical protein n=1 Tax=Labrys sedimenti TaxID=3106036 RepID=UPI002ACA9FAB|nr:hypothetical protein [Labrys sp. ZIDIC5]MDZ5448919.1 hypothetical protein [Labrys sp. ZIDIC5]